MEENPAPGPPQLSGSRLRHARRDEPAGTGARYEDTIRPAVGHLGGGVFAGRRRWLSEANLGQTYRRDRQERGGALAGELRPLPHSAARLGERTRQETR